MRERKKERVGRVVGDSMHKTVVVAVQSLRHHRLYGRTMRQTKKYMAHDEENACAVGDLVRIQESRPISRHKHWRVMQLLEQAAQRGKAVELPAVPGSVVVPAVAVVAAASDDDVSASTAGVTSDAEFAVEQHTSGEAQRQ